MRSRVREPGNQRDRALYRAAGRVLFQAKKSLSEGAGALGMGGQRFLSGKIWPLLRKHARPGPPERANESSALQASPFRRPAKEEKADSP